MQKVDPLGWLLEKDKENPGVHTFALTGLLERPGNPPEVIESQRAGMHESTD